MRRIALVVASTAAALVLLFSYRTSTGSGDVTAKISTATVVPAPASAAPQSGSTRVINGPAVQTRYGPVQVQITVSVTDGRIAAAQAIQYPTAQRRDVQINSRAVPTLNAEVLAAQSANIDAVSGASYTSDGYLSSLQSALDLAHR